MTVFIDEALIPSFEHKIEDRAESILKWSQENLTAGKIHDVPVQLTEEIKPSPVVVNELVFPTFLMKGSGRGSLAIFEDARIPAEIIEEISRRTEKANEELGGGLQPPEDANPSRDSGFGFNRPLTPEEVARMKDEQELRKNLQERQFREGLRGR